MRRKRGVDLTRNEQKVLAAALRLRSESQDRLYGYELFATLCRWEGAKPMDHGTLYRCLRSLETRGLLTGVIEDEAERRVFYALTPNGVDASWKATLQLAALDDPPSWVGVGPAILAATRTNLRSGE
jgi:Fe2+ or Zn2+ uptake regulation protein